MNITKIILICVLGILIIPIFSIIILSFQNNSGEPLKWYQSILINDEFLNSLFRSCFVSIFAAIFGVLVSFLISLSWFNKRQLFVVLMLILIVGLLPADIIALSLNKVFQLLGIYSSNYFILIYGLIYYILPFNVLLFWTGYYFIDSPSLVAAQDIGMKRFYIISRIIWPLSKTTATTCFILSFLLVFNEYPRTYYLSGSTVLLSEYLNGKLNSGADESIYAGGSITIIITAIMILGYFILQVSKKGNYFITVDKS
jgi:ABC-type spermidine/putrescine transport system permease subunit II